MPRPHRPTRPANAAAPAVAADSVHPGLRVAVCLGDPLAGCLVQSIVIGALPGSECRRYRAVDEVIDGLRAGPATMAVIGLNLSGGDGLELVEMIACERLAWRIFVILDRWDEHSIAWLRRAPINGLYDPRVEPVERLGAMLCDVVAGGRQGCVPVRADGGRQSCSLHQLMTPHEQLVFAVLGDGCDDLVAAELLRLAPETVHWHRQRIMRKLGVQSRGQLVQAAVRCGVVRFSGGSVLRPGFERALQERGSAPATAAG